nr:anti-sigma factor [Actinomycetota bacterium]
ALIWAGGEGGAGNGLVPSARTVALRPLPGSPTHAGGSAAVTSGGRLTLRVDRLPSAGHGHYYEAWLMTNTRRLVPVASFEVDHSGTARVTVPLPAPADHYRYFDVSLQSISHGTAHSHDSVLRGPTGS